VDSDKEIRSILIRLSEGDKEFALLKKDIKDLQSGIDIIINKLGEGIEPLIHWRNGTDERIPITEAMEKLIVKVSNVDERTEILDDMLKLKKAIHQIKESSYKYFFKTFYWIVSTLWKIGFALFVIMLVISLFKGDVSLIDLLYKLF
jgi:hypothetical protein